MTLWKRLLDSPAGLAVLSSLIAGYVRLVHATTRWTVVRGEIPARYWDQGEPFIGCFWHGRMLAMRFSWPRRVPIDILISAHRDGRLIAATMRRFGVGTVIGSSSRGGTAAIISMRNRLRQGVSIGITPDGPRGPRMRVAPGIIQLAALTGAAIVPASFSTTRARTLGSWDRFLLALPFGRGVYVFGEPIEVPPRPDKATLERLRRELEDRLNALTAEADRRCGQPGISPDAPAEGTLAAPEPARARAVGR
ncbi:MAG: lysophospholipid acyltransferase family protein [Alphaproteobacteria bacterium]|nr:lysophospholipid acyltransferase family protein [Alphaproteobacteria bacterium]